jgi:hypothetical protein
MVGGTTAVLSGLSRRRSLALAALALVVLVYYETSTHLWHVGTWADVAWLALVVIPGVLALIFLVLPLRDERWAIWAGLGLAVLATVLTLANADVFANFARLGAATFIAFWFLGFFDTLSWVVLVSSIIPFVDAYSVWRGPTKSIVNNHPAVFSALSVSFPAPGRITVPATATAPASSYVDAVHLGLPDLFFFAIFLGASARFGLRVFPTWVLLTLSFGGTLALASWWDLSGLPALPLLSLGFLLANADLLWRRLRGGTRVDLRSTPPRV